MNHPSRELIEIYNEFREAGGCEPDHSPADSLWITDAGDLWYIPDEDSDSWTAEIEDTISVNFEFKATDTDEAIKKALGSFRRRVLDHPLRHWARMDWPVDSKGRKISGERILKALALSLDVYRHRKAGGKHLFVASILNLTKGNNSNAEKKVRKIMFRAKRLVTAAAEGFGPFCREVIQPMPRNL